MFEHESGGAQSPSPRDGSRHTPEGRSRAARWSASAFRRRLGRGLVGVVVGAVLAVGGTSLLLSRGPANDALAQGPPLNPSEIEELIARCLFYAKKVPSRPALTVAIVDTEGNVLAVFHDTNVPSGPANIPERANRAAVAISKASTGAYFSSDEQTFSTRSAAFIIQDHFPPGVRFMPGGPLYGVEFSSSVGSDVNPIMFIQGAPTVPASFLTRDADHLVPAAAELRVRGDHGGLGLFKNRRRVGGIGIDDGNRRSRITIPEPAILAPLRADPPSERDYRVSFSNQDRGRDLERIVTAAANDFLAPKAQRADRILVGGIRLPYTDPTRLRNTQASTLSIADGNYDADPDFGFGASAVTFGTPRTPVDRPGQTPTPGAPASHFVNATLDPPAGAGPGAESFEVQVPTAFPMIAGTDGILSQSDVHRILWQGARQANITRGAIRRPIGLGMQCWVSVVDTNGAVLGVVRFKEDATLFSYDVSVQKARTAAFFSDDRIAFTSRAIGQFAQGFYPAGQQDQGRGPLHQVQDGLFVGLLTGGLESARLRNGITIFPGGVPLYKNGALAGGCGVSGDGVDQDDIVADFASRAFGAPPAIKCDNVSHQTIKSGLQRALNRLRAEVDLGPNPPPTLLGIAGRAFFEERFRVSSATLDRTEISVPTPYVKYPRHPGPVTIRR